MQLDQPEKGFSFSKEGPLDMRMGPATQLTAGEIVNHWSEKKLGKIFRDYGEEPKWRQAAKAIVEARRKTPFETTSELAEFLAVKIGFRGKRKLHPATLIFQALRICVNGELESLEKGLIQAIRRLSTGGRIGVISFHSLEDRIVKNIFREEAMQKKTLRLLTKKPLVPTDAEIKKNPRARSAKMRFAEKL